MATAEKVESGSRAAQRKSGALFEVIAFMARAGEVARQRRNLMRLDDSALKDFGASRADADNEGSKPWWDLPRDR
jgi:uncharacterized protein YjiS (DUF1127 family)